MSDPRTLSLALRSPSGATGASADDAELRARMGRYVAQLLPLEEALRWIPWPLGVTWSQRSLTAYLSRGDLQIRADITARAWWIPQRKSRARDYSMRLSRVLAATHRLYADVDLTGRRRMEFFRTAAGTLGTGPSRGARPVQVILEPGVRTGTVNGGSLGLFYRLGEDVGLLPDRAEAEGWIRVLP